MTPWTNDSGGTYGRPCPGQTKLGRLEEYRRGLAAQQAISREAYLRDRDGRDVVERRLEKSIQACFDVASHVGTTEGFREPTDDGDLFRVLEADAVVTTAVADRTVELAGFRNGLAHEYARIDDDRLYDHSERRARSNVRAPDSPICR